MARAVNSGRGYRPAGRIRQQEVSEAERLNYNYLGTGHILLGLATQAQRKAARVLAELGVNLNEVRSAVQFAIERSGVGRHLTPQAKKAIELAVNEAWHLGHPYVGTEHLLGLIRQGERVAADVLDGFGIEMVRNATAKVVDLDRREPSAKDEEEKQ